MLTPQRADGPSLMMRHPCQLSVQYINRTYQRTGTLWEGRFKSCLAQEEEYALRCYRYIELNPVRACMVSHPREYPWSSFHSNRDGACGGLLGPHWSYLSLGKDKRERARAYTALIESQLSEEQLHEIRCATNGNFVPGNSRFQREIECALEQRVARGSPGLTPARK